MSSYYTPPPSASSHWSQSPMFPQPQQSIPSQATSQPTVPIQSSSPVNGHNPMYTMMAMMQQMQQSFSHLPQHQQHFPQQQQQQPQPQPQPQPTPSLEQPKMPTPQPSDNNFLASVLYEQTSKGLSYKAALESMHGHNGIMAFAWKDYFLENKQTIDALVDQLRDRASSNSVCVKHRSPSPSIKSDWHDSASVDRERSQSVVRSQVQFKSRASEERSTSVTKNRNAKESTPTRTVKIKEKTRSVRNSRHATKATSEGGPSRRTLNSLSSAASNDLLDKVPPAVAIDAHTGLPAPPSRSPSPPPVAPNSRYTEQDTIFFFRRIAYDLARDPDLSKARLCELLGEKAPHHSAQSWLTYWKRHEDVADKMYLLTSLDEEDREKAIQSWKGGISTTVGNARSRAAARRVSYKESSDSDVHESDSESSSSSSGSSESSESEDDDDAQGSTDEEEALGEAGSPFTKAEMRVFARHIAKDSGWHKGKRDWEGFFKAYPQRTSAAWREFYRRRAPEIDALAKKYKRKAKKETESISAQRGIPSWARKPSSAVSTPVVENGFSMKRKMFGEGPREQSEEKRPKVEDVQ